MAKNLLVRGNPDNKDKSPLIKAMAEEIKHEDSEDEAVDLEQEKNIMYQDEDPEEEEEIALD